MPDDPQPLATFARTGSPDAFRALVALHIDLVYAAARRQAHDSHDAEDITQAVFIVLARKARAIPSATLLPAWLLKATHLAAINARRDANRRRHHEQEAAAMMPTTAAPSDPEWDKLSPFLDAALTRLSATDRAAIIAHCIHEESIAQLAATLHVSEPAARKRVQRALQRLRALLERDTKSPPPSLLALPALLATHGLTPAPPALASAVATTAATLHGTAATGSAFALAKGVMHMMFLAKAKLACAIALALILLATITTTAAHYALAQSPQPAFASVPASTTTPPGTQPAVWVALLVKSPLRSIADYHTVLSTDPASVPPLLARVAIPDCELEFRRAKDQARLVRIPRREFLRDAKIGERSRDWNFLDQADRRRIGSLPNGDYLMALCIGELRISNVAEFQINSGFDPTKEPALRAIPIEPGSGREPRYLGLRGIAPGLNAPAGFGAAFCFPDLVIDGSRIVRPGPSVFMSPSPIPPGQQCESIIDLRLYGPNLALDKPHTIIAGSGKYQADKVQLALSQDLGRSWDDATGKVKPPPELPVMFAGQVIGPDGKPAKGYEVTLGNDTTDPPRTESDDQGRYSFINIPPGNYQLACSPLQMGSPELTVDNITIPVTDPLHHDLDMTSQCTLAGSIHTPDGKPAAKIDVDLVVQSAQGRAEFHTTTQTDEQGRYELASTLGVVTYLGIKGKLIEVTYFDNKGNLVQGKLPVLKSGQNHADYVLRDSTARPVSRGGR